MRIVRSAAGLRSLATLPELGLGHRDQRRARPLPPRTRTRRAARAASSERGRERHAGRPQHRSRDLRGRLAELPERLRQALLLRYYEGMSEPEIADALGIARGTVKSRLHTAVMALRRSLGGVS